MAPSATSPGLPPQPAPGDILKNSKESPTEHPAHLHHLASTVLHNLQYQHDWTSLVIHTHTTIDNLPLPRPIISGMPPRRAYINPDEQAEIIKAEHEAGQSIDQLPEQEWVLPTYMTEKWSLAEFAGVFDALDTVPPTNEDSYEEESAAGGKWRGKNRQKRLLLATLHNDSTVVYYIMHDGVVKPRQN